MPGSNGGLNACLLRFGRVLTTTADYEERRDEYQDMHEWVLNYENKAYETGYLEK